jgi:cyclophilin family peptidyl-prolyl cis-trans isomerase
MEGQATSMDSTRRRKHKANGNTACTGYYDNVIFHRIVPGFIAQTGDPTGTGMGGESFYGGEPR